MFSFINISFDPGALQQGISQVSSASAPSWDTFILLVFLFGVVTNSFFVNRERLAVVLLSVYASLAIVLSTPVITNALAILAHDEVYKFRLGGFFTVFLILYVLLARQMTLRSEVGHTWWQTVLLSFFQVGLFLSCVMSLIPRNIFPSDFASLYFTGDISRSFWMLAPIAIMVIMKRRTSGAHQERYNP